MIAFLVATTTTAFQTKWIWKQEPFRYLLRAQTTVHFRISTCTNTCTLYRYRISLNFQASNMVPVGTVPVPGILCLGTNNQGTVPFENNTGKLGYGQKFLLQKESYFTMLRTQCNWKNPAGEAGFFYFRYPAGLPYRISGRILYILSDIWLMFSLSNNLVCLHWKKIHKNNLVTVLDHVLFYVCKIPVLYRDLFKVI
jgi:hypothetical protein